MPAADALDHRLADAMELLLAPLAYEDVDAWRGAVSGALKELVGADAALIKLPANLVGPGERLAHSEDVDVAPYLAPYGEALAPLDDWFDVWDRAAALGVCDRRTLWGAWLGAYYESAYFHEFVRPVQFFGSALLTLGGGTFGGGTFGSDTLASEDGQQAPAPHPSGYDAPGHDASGYEEAFQIALGRSDRRAEFDGHGDARFQISETDLRALALLRPAARAAVETLRRFARYRSGLVQALDATGAAVLLADGRGIELHRTPALVVTTEGLAPEQAEALVAGVRRCARAVAAPDGPGAAMCSERIGGFRVHGTIFRVHGTVLRGAGGLRAGGAADRERLVAVVVTQRDGLPSEGELCVRFELTPQQARVALLLARRRTNREVADALCISPHTAHRHTHAVLSKLDVRSRRDVRSRLTSTRGPDCF